jgi:hypothetical protein
MYTFIIQDVQGNFFISKQYFHSEQEALENSFDVAEYDFVASVEVIKCEDVVCFNALHSTLN